METTGTAGGGGKEREEVHLIFFLLFQVTERDLAQLENLFS